MSKKNGKKKSKDVEIIFALDGIVVKGIPKGDLAARATALKVAIEMLVDHIHGQREAHTTLEAELEAARQELEELKERRRTDARISADSERDRKAEIASLKRRYGGSAAILENIQYLSKVFGPVEVGVQITNRFGALVTVEAGGLVFTLSSPTSRDPEVFAMSAEDTRIKIQATNLELTDEGLLGTAALGTIEMLRQAITDEGRKQLRSLNPNDANELYGTNSRQNAPRGTRLAERCLHNRGNRGMDAGRLSQENPSLNNVAAATIESLGRTKAFDNQTNAEHTPRIDGSQFFGAADQAKINGHTSTTPQYTLDEVMTMLRELLPLEPGVDDYVIMRRSDLETMGINRASDTSCKHCSTSPTT